MTLKLVCSSICFVAFALTNPASLLAESKNNPYRSFNISGINYGANQWDREHRSQVSRSSATPAQSRRGLIFRRR